MQGDALVGRDEQHAAPPQRDVGEGGGGGRRGVALDDQEDAGAVHRGDGVLLHRGRDLGGGNVYTSFVGQQHTISHW